jgi:K+-sensing histidine kinase KdpD
VCGTRIGKTYKILTEGTARRRRSANVVIGEESAERSDRSVSMDR